MDSRFRDKKVWKLMAYLANWVRAFKNHANLLAYVANWVLYTPFKVLKQPFPRFWSSLLCTYFSNKTVRLLLKHSLPCTVDYATTSMGTSAIHLCSIKSSLPSLYPLHHSRDKSFQAFYCFSVLQATESCAGPGNEANLLYLITFSMQIQNGKFCHLLWCHVTWDRQKGNTRREWQLQCVDQSKVFECRNSQAQNPFIRYYTR